MEQKKETVSFPMTDLKVPQDPFAPGYSSSYTKQSYAPDAMTKKSSAVAQVASKSYIPEQQASKSYTPDLYASKSNASDMHASKSCPPDPYAPKSYSSDACASKSYRSDLYGPKSYSSDACAPISYSSDPYAPKSYSLDPYTLQPSAPEYTEISDNCSYTIEIISDECPDPPPYSEVHCDKGQGHAGQSGCGTAVNQPPVVVAGIFSSKPASTICPCCRQIITTEVVFRVGSLTYALCTCMCMVGCCLGCCLAPFACKCCKDVDHYCPCCRYHIYRYKRI